MGTRANNDPLIQQVTPMDDLQEAKAALSSALTMHAAKAATATQDELRVITDVVRDARKGVSRAITKGANPCPFCKAEPLGMEHPTQRGGVEYQVGCIACPPFLHTDGTKRQVSARGGTMPHHAVDAWNAGADFWIKVPA